MINITEVSNDFYGFYSDQTKYNRFFFQISQRMGLNMIDSLINMQMKLHIQASLLYNVFQMITVISRVCILLSSDERYK